MEFEGGVKISRDCVFHYSTVQYCISLASSIGPADLHTPFGMPTLLFAAGGTYRVFAS